MEINKEKIAIITTVSNWDLYEKTKMFFPAGIKIFAIDGTKGFYGINSLVLSMKDLKKKNVDWLIMADEDVIFTNTQKVFQLINYLAANDYSACGMRDGGTLEWRNKNPLMVNTYFSILHLNEIYTIYDQDVMLKNQYVLENEFKKNLQNLPFQNYDTNSLFEGYYCFFLWLLRNNKKIKYLDATNPIKGDYATTRLLDHGGEEILYHTWYARFFNKDSAQTQRINKILEYGVPTGSNEKVQMLKNDYYHFKLFFYSYSRKFLRIIKK